MIDSYSTLPLGKYYELKKVIETDGEPLDMQVSMLAIINDMTEDDILNLPLDRYAELVSSLDFLMEEPKAKNLRSRKFNINGHRYELMKSVDRMTAGQYIDYQSYQDSGLGFEYILSTLLIPVGKNYGEYDSADVIGDILELDVQSCMDVCFFFHRKWVISILASLISSDLKIRRVMRKAPKEKQEELKQVRKMIREQISSISGIGSTVLT